MKKQKKQPAGFASFSDYYDYSRLRKEIGTTGLFLCLFCVVLAIVFFVRGLAAVGAQEILSYAFAGFFLLVLLAYLLFPVKLFQFLWKLRPFTDRVGKYLLRAILLPVYLLLWGGSGRNTALPRGQSRPRRRPPITARIPKMCFRPVPQAASAFSRRWWAPWRKSSSSFCSPFCCCCCCWVSSFTLSPPAVFSVLSIRFSDRKVFL